MRGDVNLGYSQDVEGIILGFLQSHWHSFYKGSKIRGTRGHWGHSRYQRGVHLLAKPQIQENHAVFVVAVERWTNFLAYAYAVIFVSFYKVQSPEWEIFL